MSPLPRVSVIIPSYNHAPFVGEAVRSVLAQDHPDVELVVVDDGSTDGSPELLRELLSRAPAGRAIFERQDNAGAHAAIARGIERATGDLIAILNSDDYYAPARLSRMIDAIAGSGEALAFSGLEFVDAEGEPVEAHDDLVRWHQLALRQSAQCPTLGFALLCNNVAVTSGNLVFSRGLYGRVGGFRPLRYCHDWDFILRCLQHVEPIFVPEPLICYRLHGGNTIGLASGADVDAEYSAILTDYLRRCEADTPSNALAPCPDHWPLFFPYFARTHTRFNSKLIAELVAEPALVDRAARAAFGGRWEAWSSPGGVAAPGRAELGRLCHARGAGAGDLERQALLRELALVRSGLHEGHPSFAPPGRADRALAELWRGVRAGVGSARHCPGDDD